MSKGTIIDKIKTFEDACLIAGVNPVLFNKHCLDCYYPEHIIAELKLELIIAVINEGWKPNWNDSKEYKYYPYFNMTGGFAFVGTASYFARTATHVGSRLCFKTEKDAKYTAKQFINLYRIFYTYQNDITRNTLFEKFKANQKSKL